ncbi:hypothetical protein NDN08_003990 [Rhodosorus marinus]|uniref:Uncharacterized protein n=1 Tax=Rhodosorus marinus TaxID=101924 RepID=A0AAV8UH02_9RHOD|nr:hypothetical protein NDN08_003990 [Rhodosorus marinus]
MSNESDGKGALHLALSSVCTIVQSKDRFVLGQQVLQCLKNTDPQVGDLLSRKSLGVVIILYGKRYVLEALSSGGRLYIRHGGSASIDEILWKLAEVVYVIEFYGKSYGLGLSRSAKTIVVSRSSKAGKAEQYLKAKCARKLAKFIANKGGVIAGSTMGEFDAESRSSQPIIRGLAKFVDDFGPRVGLTYRRDECSFHVLVEDHKFNSDAFVDRLQKKELGDTELTFYRKVQERTPGVQVASR